MLRLQVLLAVAQGAFILTPEWVTASLEAGRWLPEAKFISEVHPAPCPSTMKRMRSATCPHELTCFLLRSCSSPMCGPRLLNTVCRSASRRPPSVSGGSGCCPGRCRLLSASASTSRAAQSATLPNSRACGAWWRLSEQRRARPSQLPVCVRCTRCRACDARCCGSAEALERWICPRKDKHLVGCLYADQPAGVMHPVRPAGPSSSPATQGAARRRDGQARVPAASGGELVQ